MKKINATINILLLVGILNAQKPSSERPNLSELKDEDFVQNTTKPARSENNTRYGIASNLAIEMKGKYPEGYAPKWRFINEKSYLKVTVENWMRPTSNVQYDNYALTILSYNNTAVLRLKPFMGCECFADIVVKGGTAVINETPQTFQIANFRKILNERSTGEPCVAGTNWSNSWEVAGGFEGRLTLSANDNGDLLMDFMLENYSADHKNRKGELSKPSQVSRRYVAKNITIENEMSPEKAIAIVETEKKTKQAQKDYEIKSKRQADSLLKVIAKKYPEPQCKECFYSSRGGYISSSTQRYVYYDGSPAPPETSYDYNTVINIKNKCKYDIMFVGIGQYYDQTQGYYLKEVTKTMPSGYSYSSDQGLAGTVLSSLMGGGSDFDLTVWDSYKIQRALIGSVQWLKVIRSK